jgi:epoxyqueuosine reductase
LSLEQLVKAQACGLGFDLVGITSLGPMETAGAFDDWVARGYAGEMDYLPRGAAKRRDSRLPLAGTASAIVVGLDYGGRAPSGPIARYARGDDYHDLMLGKLEDLHKWLESELGRPVKGKPYVDTGPILERDLARRAGLGWFGKNTNLVNPRIWISLPMRPSKPTDVEPARVVSMHVRPMRSSSRDCSMLRAAFRISPSS